MRRSAADAFSQRVISKTKKRLQYITHTRGALLVICNCYEQKAIRCRRGIGVWPRCGGRPGDGFFVANGMAFAANGGIEAKLEGKSARERADIKAAEIVNSDPKGTYQDATYGLRIEIQSVAKIDGGVEVFARAWRGATPLGFGEDGSVEIERFRIFNPPVLVDDPNGRTSVRLERKPLTRKKLI